MITNSDSASYHTGKDLYGMFVAGTSLLELNVEAVNALNVFPVPDGDTGTNMLLTMKGVVGDPSSIKSSAGDMAEQMARNALMEARGNSGVILSQFFKGLADGMEGMTCFGVEELSDSFSAARKNAYNAVGQPVEGTILTVISSISEAAVNAVESGVSVTELLEVVCSSANDTVMRTPEMLEVLSQAGVVDAGGRGLALILEGARRHLNGQPVDDKSLPVGEKVSGGLQGRISDQFLAVANDEEYGYCTQFMIEGELLNIDQIRSSMDDIAHSTVVVGDDSMVKVHVHAEDPGKILSSGIAYGTLSRIDIRSMDEQHSEFSDSVLGDSGTTPAAIIPVALGTGIKALFRSLGASIVMSGGNTANPSVGDILAAIDSVESDNVILLPNNGNIIPAARQASENSSKCVCVVESRTIPQGVAAILCFNSDRDVQANVSDMEGAISSVRTLEVTESVRDMTLDGISAVSGQLIGLTDGKLTAVGDDLQSVVDSILDAEGVSGGDLVTLYWGDRIVLEDVEGVERQVKASFPGVDVEVVDGGQPNYHLIMSIE